MATKHVSPPYFALRTSVGFVLAALVSLPSPVLAEEWRVTPHLTLIETYTDNVLLAPSGSAKSDWVTQITPGVSIEGKGPKLRVRADYALQNVLYADLSHRNESYHQLAANANATLVENTLFLDAAGNLQQQATSLLGPISRDNVNPDNISDIYSYSISPYLVHRFGPTAVGRARFSHDAMGSGTAGLFDNATNRAQLNLDSGPAFHDWGWGLAYSAEKVDYKQRPDTDSKIFSGTASYRLFPKVRISATAGYEKSHYLYTTNKPQSAFWSAGASWAPTTRTSLSASMGERYFGKTYSMAFNHKTASSVWQMSYSQDITSLRGEIINPEFYTLVGQYYDYLTIKQGTIPTNQEVLLGALSAAIYKGMPLHVLTNQLFLSKQFLGSVAVKKGKSVATLVATHSVRKAQETAAYSSIFANTDALMTTEDTVKQYGLNAGWNVRVSQRNTATLDLGVNRSVFELAARTDDYQYLALGLTRNLARKVSGAIEFRHTERDSSANANDYAENAISAKLLWTFN